MNPIRTESLPRPAIILSTIGLLPIVLLSIQVAAEGPLDPRLTGMALYALLLYGAVVLSFLGGIQWGLAVANADRSDAWRRYGLSIVPPLLGWAAAWINGDQGLVLLAVGLGLWGLYELWSTGLGEAPQWYGRLRLVLTVASVAALAAAIRYGTF